MSLYKCVSCFVRNRTAVERLTSSALPVLTQSIKVPNVVDSATPHVLAKSTIPSIQVVPYRSYGKKYRKSKSSSSSSSDSSDSDKGKGKGKKSKKGQSQFWKQKMRTHHMALDINKDGVVSWDDFEVLIKNFATLGNLPKEELEKFTNAMKHVWEEEWGASGDPYVFISYEQFMSNMEHVVNTKDLRKKVAKPLPYFFSAVDWDHSGEISIQEFITFFKCLNLSEEAARETFAVIDLNGDGTLSKKEFVRLGKEFFLSEDENSPSKSFWGPLRS